MGSSRHRRRELFLPTTGAFQDAVWQPAADLYRIPRGWLIKFDLAGVRPDEVQLSLRGQVLSVQGTRRDWLIKEECCQIQMEIAYSRFERRIELPEELDDPQISTEQAHGMMIVRIEGRRAE